MTKNNQQPTCIGAVCKNQTLTITHCSWNAPMEGHQKKSSVQSDIRMLLGKDCEVEKVISFLKEVGVFEEK